MSLIQQNKEIATIKITPELEKRVLFSLLDDVSSEKIELAKQARVNLSILEDISKAQEALELAKSKDEAILSSLGDGVVVINKDKKIFLFNEAAEKIFGYKMTQMIDNDYRLHLKFCFQDGTCLLPEQFPTEGVLITGKPFVTDISSLIYCERLDKTRFPAYVKISPIKLGKEIAGVVVIFRDMTVEKEIDKMKTEFVSLASHQLRTPLTSMNWNLEMLLAGDAGEMSETQKEYIKEVYEGSKRMVRLVGELLNVSRLEAGRLKIEPVPTQLENFIQNILNEAEPLGKAKKCSLILNKPSSKIPKVAIDPSLMRQVVHNLITNAIRYSLPEKKCKIEIDLKVLDIKSLSIKFVSDKKFKVNQVLISVKDYGIGIPKEAQSRIFEKFFRAGNAVKAEAEGSGLGMYVAKMIIEASGGSIWFESSGVGTTFYVAIPIVGMITKAGDKGLV